ncbi:hypothetical protein M8J75_005192 [Diaphorina citri]|nr:hypothetical protein M8J75_005192 [Diaphorina citri]
MESKSILLILLVSWSLFACKAQGNQSNQPQDKDYKLAPIPTFSSSQISTNRTSNGTQYQFNLRECVRTVAKIELLEDAYDALIGQLERIPGNVVYFITVSSNCRWPVNYFECLDSSFRSSEIMLRFFQISGVLYNALRVMQAMFIGVFRCFTHYYY